MLHVDFCLSSGFVLEDKRRISKAPLGFYESLRHKFSVYVMTHAQRLTSGNHSGADHLRCFALMEKILTHWRTLSRR